MLLPRPGGVGASSRLIRAKVLLDVDGTAILGESHEPAKLNLALLQFSLCINCYLRQQGVEVMHHLFTARSVLATLEYAYMDYIAHEKKHEPSLSLLTNIVKRFEEDGLEFGREFPVIQIFDALTEWKLGKAYQEVHGPLERLLMSEDQALLQILDGWLESKLVEVPKRVDAITGQIHKELEQGQGQGVDPITNAVVQACKASAVHRAKLKRELGVNKTAVLAKLLEAEGIDNTLYIWVDDMLELYQQALADKTTLVRGERLSEVMNRCVVFIHHDFVKPPEAAEAYLHLLVEGLERSGCHHFREYFSWIQPKTIAGGGAESTAPIPPPFATAALAPAAEAVATGVSTHEPRECGPG